MIGLILFLSLTINLFVYLVLNIKKTKSKKMLPGPTGLPFIGCALQIAKYSKKFKHFEIYQEFCKQYGPVIGLQAGLQYMVLIEDFDTAKSVLSSEDWAGRMPDHEMYRERTMNQNIGIMFGFNDSWKENRRFVLKNLREFGFSIKNALEVHLVEELEFFLKHFEEVRGSTPSNEINFHQCFKLSSLNILWRTLCGTRLDEKDEKIKYFIEMVEKTIAMTSTGSQPKYAFPFLRKIPGLTNTKQQIEALEIIQNFFRDIIQERRKIGTFRTEQKDFLDMYLKKIEEARGKPNTIFTDDQIVQTCTDMFFAGADTTGAALEFAILYMLKFPEIQKKVQHEIDSVMKSNAAIPSLDDRESMPFTEAVLLETLRFATIVPVIPRSCCLGNTSINGCFVPKNSLAIINAYKINHDEKIWNKPDEFMPERFLDSNGLIKKDTANMILSFGAGKRLCVGITTAKASMFTFFTAFFQKYEVHPSLNYPNISLKAIVSGINNQPKPFHGIVHLRKTKYS